MGTFHCPMGSPFYGDDVCIECELCMARTKEEAAAALEKIRDHLRPLSPPTVPGKKIAVCGKGGTGKSTTVALMARALAAGGHRVLVVDTDESNPGLHRLFGFDRVPKPLVDVLVNLPSIADRQCNEW